jgi:hypothetical protein
MKYSDEKVYVQAIARLNDELRRTHSTGRVMMTVGFDALPAGTWTKAIKAIQQFSNFTPDNDPHGEHDFGQLEVDGISLIWKIDYYDLSYRYLSPNAADPAVTHRVLTMMLAEEY